MEDEYNPRGLWLKYGTIEEMRERQNRMLREAEEARQRAATEKRKREAWLARPCERYGKSGTAKDRKTLRCRSCDEVMSFVTVIEACGGTNQTPEQLAEKLHANDYRILGPEDDQW